MSNLNPAYNPLADKAIRELVYFLHGKKDAPLKILEVGCGSGERSAYLAKTFTHWNIVASDFKRERPKGLPSSVRYLSQDVHDLAFESDTFDVVFSVSVSEHYSDTEKALREQFRVLKSEGLFYFVHTPFYYCSKGHHAHYSPEHCKIFPPYGHLYMNEDEFLTASSRRVELYGLENRFSAIVLNDLVNRIYNRHDLSRLWHREFKLLFESMPFNIIQWLEIDDPLFAESDAREVLFRLPTGTTVHDLKVEKLRCAALKKVNFSV